jgi:hypothetical protein
VVLKEWIEARGFWQKREIRKNAIKAWAVVGGRKFKRRRRTRNRPEICKTK